MNVISGLGGAAKSLVVRFLADTAKGTRDVNTYFANIRRQAASVGGLGIGRRGVAGMGGQALFRGGMLYGYGPWMRGGGGMLFDKTARAGKETARVLDEAAGTSSALSKAGKGLNNTLRRTVLSVGRTGTAFTALGGILQAIPGWAKVAIIALLGLRQIFKFGNVIEQAKMVMESIYGSENRALKTVAGMREFSRKTQFLPEAIVGGTTMLIKYGVDPFKKGAFGLAKDKHAMDIMAGLAAMPGMEGQPIGLSRAINAAIAGRDIRPLKALGPEVLAAYTKARKAGISGSPEYIKVMMTELAKIPRIMALAEAQLNTMTGMWSTIKGYVEEIFMDISGAEQQRGVLTFWSQIKSILIEVRGVGEQLITKLKPFFIEFGAMLGSIIKYMYTSVKYFFNLIRPLLPPILAILRIFNQLIIFVAQTLTKALELFMKIVNRFYKAFGIDKLMNKLEEFIVGLQMYIQFWGIYIDYAFEKIIKNIDKLFEKLKALKPFMELLGNAVTGNLGAYVGEKISEKTGIGKIDTAIQRSFDRNIKEPMIEAIKEGWNNFLERQKAAAGWGEDQKLFPALIDNLKKTNRFLDNLNRKMSEERGEAQKSGNKGLDMVNPTKAAPQW